METYDQRTEALVLGAALNSHDNLATLCDQATPDLFQNTAHKHLFLSLFELYVKDVEATPSSAYNMAKDLNVPVELPFILGLTNETTKEEDIAYFVNKLKKIRRNNLYISALKTASSNLEKATSADEEIDSLFTQLESFTGAPQGGLQTVNEVLQNNFRDTGLSFQDYIKKKRDDHTHGRKTLSGISTGFDKLDAVTDGLQPSWFYVFGARPSEGKTQFLLNLFKNVVSQGIPALLFSLELPASEVAFEIATITSKTSYKELNEGTADAYDYAKIMEAEQTIKDWPLVIDDQPSLTTNQIRVRVKQAIRSHGIKVIFLDYLQEVRSNTKHPNQQENMQAVSRALREIAKEFRIPLVCAAQVNRESEKTEDSKPPLASHLRESGQIEQCAWFIGMLHRPDKTDPNNYPGMLNLYVRKNRFGERPKISYSHSPDSPSYSFRIEELR